MQRTVRIKLPRDESLINTIRIYSQIYNYIAKVGLKNKTYAKVKLHYLIYKTLRVKYPNFPSALLQTVRDVACEALRRTKLKKKINVSKYSSIRLDKRNLRVNLKHGLISISSINGRLKFNFNTNPLIEKYLNWNPIAGTLSYRNKKLFLNVVINKETSTPELSNPKILGIDRGVNNIIVCSSNQFINSNHLKKVKGKYQYLKKALQSKGTRSARRKLKRLAGREKRFISDLNHRLSKSLANSDYSVFVMEQLNIKKNKKNGRRFNKKLGSWSFKQLETFLKYKCEALGKTVLSVNPKYTSQKCSKCGHTDKGNRNGSRFKCLKCSYELHADLNASRNIAQLGISSLSRLNVNQPIVTREIKESVVTNQLIH